MGCQGAFRFSRRAGCVHDRGAVFRAQINFRPAAVRQILPAIGVADIVFHRADPGIIMLFIGIARDDDVLQIGQIIPVPAHALIEMQIDDGQLHFGEGQAIVQLFTRPPGIHRGGNRAQAERSIKSDRPLRIVPHHDGDPVALFHAIGVAHHGGHGTDGLRHRLEGNAFILVNDIIPIRELGLSQRQDKRNGRRRVLVNLHLNAIDDGIFQFKRRARPSQHFIGLGNRHGGPVWQSIGGHGFPLNVCFLHTITPRLRNEDKTR